MIIEGDEYNISLMGESSKEYLCMKTKYTKNKFVFLDKEKFLKDKSIAEYENLQKQIQTWDIGLIISLCDNYEDYLIRLIGENNPYVLDDDETKLYSIL